MIFSHGTRELVRERVRRFFGGMPRRIQVAALPWRHGYDGQVEMLLVTSCGTGRWVLPKGWPEGGESLSQAAMREAAEEAGVSGTMSDSAVGSYFYTKQLRRGRQWRCQVHVYPLEVTNLADKWQEHKKRSRQWFRPQDAARLVDEPDLGELISRFDGHPKKFAA